MRWHEWPVVTGGAPCTLGGAWRCVRVTSRTRHTVHVSVTHVMSPTHWPLSLSGCRLCNMVSGARWFAGCVVECLLCFPHLAPRHWLRCDNKVAMLRAPFARFLSLLWACVRALKHKPTEFHTFRSTIFGAFTRTFFVDVNQAICFKLLNSAQEP